MTGNPPVLPKNARKLIQTELEAQKSRENAKKAEKLAKKELKASKRHLNCPVLKHIFTNYGLKPGKNPTKHPCLSGVVEVLDPTGRGWCNIRFEPTFVTRLGKAMPKGLSPDNPGVLRLLFRPVDRVWALHCTYYENSLGPLLAEYHTIPSWLGTVYRPKGERSG